MHFPWCGGALSRQVTSGADWSLGLSWGWREEPWQHSTSSPAAAAPPLQLCSQSHYYVLSMSLGVRGIIHNSSLIWVASSFSSLRNDFRYFVPHFHCSLVLSVWSRLLMKFIKGKPISSWSNHRPGRRGHQRRGLGLTRPRPRQMLARGWRSTCGLHQYGHGDGL